MRAKLDLDRSRVVTQYLLVGVGGDEFHVSYAELHHPSYGIAPATSQTDYL
jgi:hypothetical protein